MRNEKSDLCIDVEGLKNSDLLKLSICDANKPTQKWEFVYGSNTGQQ